MLIYMAPMEGVTNFTYRNSYNEVFGQVDKYMTPFICPTPTKSYQSKEYKEMSTENNKELDISLQLLTNDAQLLLKGARDIASYGYKDINLNLGCPSGTVVSKNRGSGFLAYPEKLDKFLDEVYNGLEALGLKMSIKTRIGRDNSEDFGEILEIYNKYPVSELIIHPRITRDMYKGTPNMEVFKAAYENCKCPLIYNGDVTCVADFQRIEKEYPNLKGIMIGRGLIANPFLPGAIKGIKLGSENEIKKYLELFNNTLIDKYLEHIPERRNVLFKMKEVWLMMVGVVADNDKFVKQIKKSATLDELIETANRIYTSGKIRADIFE